MPQEPMDVPVEVQVSAARVLGRRRAVRFLWGVLVVLAAAALMINRVQLHGQAFDFIDHYNGAQAALRGESPYSEAVTERNQIAWYGGTTTDGDPQRFNYPAYSIFIFGILTVFPPETAIVVWAVLQFALCMVMLMMMGRGALAALLVFLLLREPLVSLLLAQSTLWAAGWVGLGLVALERRFPVRAGLCFALSSLHPVLTVPLALIVLLRERRALATYVVVMVGWMALSILAFGWWIPAWFDNLLNYSSGVSYMVWIARQVPILLPVGVVLLVAGLRGRAALRRFILALCAVVLLLPLTGLYHLSLFLPVVARMKWRWLAAVGVAAWLLSPLAFAVRQWEALLLVAIVLCWEFRAALPVKWMGVRTKPSEI